MSEIKTVVLELEVAYNKMRVLLKFPYDDELIKAAKTIKNVRWSSLLSSWHVEWRKSILKEISNAFANVAIIDDSLIRDKLKTLDLLTNEQKLSTEVRSKIEQFKQWMQIKRYSSNSIQTYTDALNTFFSFHQGKSISDINNADIIEFNDKHIIIKKLSSSYQNQFVSALKLFYRKIENINIDTDLIPRPRRGRRLPNVLSKEEVKMILEAPKNLKHKAMLSLIYSSGLRCGELLKLKKEHVDYNRKLINIKDAKGMRDRITPLSRRIAELLDQYLKAFKPVDYLFEGQKAGMSYDERSLQLVLKQAIARAGIKKPVTLHWLRHSFATHLLESGTDTRYIQEILGHKSSRTTEIYTHVSKKSIQNITSPFDEL